VNRWTAFRIDLQAYLIATAFSYFALFLSNFNTDIALLAISFQLVVEIARHFNSAVRWTSDLENYMVNVQRLLEYCKMKGEDN